MKQKLDLDNWVRKDHFQFFNRFEEPFFGVTVSIDCTIAYQKAKAAKQSFFLYYLHKSLLAANAVEPFRYRIEGDEIMIYDEIHPSPTINRPDGTFGFAYMPFKVSFDEFVQESQKEIERVQASTGLVPAGGSQNVIHYSSMPWLNFSAVSHARSFSFKDSCPKITFGKMMEEDEKRTMSVAIHVHHALMDGYHVGQFVEIFQKLMNEGK